MSDTLVAPTVTLDELLETWPTTLVDIPHKEGVAQEARRLDRLYPGWHNRINTEGIEMSSCTRCILGQSTDEDFDFAYDRVARDAAAHGETQYGPAYASRVCVPFWLNEIMDRRAA